jgi:hypothetical protein
MVPAGRDDVVIPNAGGLILSDSAAVVATEALSVSLTVKLDNPADPGVPEMDPSAERFSPAGNDPLANDHEYGGVPPVAPRVCE